MRQFEEKDKPETWKVVRELFRQLIVPSKSWESAEIIATPEEMARYFRAAFPEVDLSMEDMRLALHDLNIPFYPNEHNQKFYYLANWIASV